MGQLRLLMQHQQHGQGVGRLRQQPRHHRAQHPAFLHPIHIARLLPHPPAQADGQDPLPPLVFQLL
ncbi:hypothetical protein D3C81_2113250 [compost metagenome]